MFAARKQDKWLYNKIMKGYGDVNVRGVGRDGNRLLHLVAQWGDEDVIMKLLKRKEFNSGDGGGKGGGGKGGAGGGGNVLDIVNNDGESLLAIMFKKGLKRGIEFMLKRPDVDISQVLGRVDWVKYMYVNMYDEFITQVKIGCLSIEELRNLCHQLPDDEKLGKLLLARVDQDKVNDEIIRNKTKCCDICMEEYTEKWVILPCGHTNCCGVCLEHIKKSGRMKCPKCREPITDTMRIFD